MIASHVEIIRNVYNWTSIHTRFQRKSKIIYIPKKKKKKKIKKEERERERTAWMLQVTNQVVLEQKQQMFTLRNRIYYVEDYLSDVDDFKIW